MPVAFLLRYQEFCVEELPDMPGGVHPITTPPDESAREAAGGGSASPTVGGKAHGTQTKTSVDNEQGGRDPDRTEAQLHAIPPFGSHAPTAKTLTRVKREQADRACGEAASRTIPLPTAPPSCLTKTATAVRAEAEDRDPNRASSEAIPRCS